MLCFLLRMIICFEITLSLVSNRYAFRIRKLLDFHTKTYNQTHSNSDLSQVFSTDLFSLKYELLHRSAHPATTSRLASE